MTNLDTTEGARLLDEMRKVDPDAFDRVCRAIRAMLDGDRYVPCIVCGDEHGRSTWRTRTGDYDDGQCQHEAEAHMLRTALRVVAEVASAGLDPLE